MAKSGHTDVTVTSWDTLRFAWEESSQSTVNNETVVYWELQLIATTYGYITTSSNRAWSVTVNGTNYEGKSSVSINNNTTKTLASGTTTIKHNADGSKTFSYSFSQTFNITFSDVWRGTYSGSGTGTLDPIPREAELITAYDFTDSANSVSITFNNRAGTAVTELWLCIGDTNWAAITPYKEITNRSGSSFTYTITESDKTLLRRACTKNSMTVRYYLRSTIGGAYYWSTLDKKFSIENPLPILSPTITNTHPSAAVINDPSKIVKGLNTINYAIGASAVKEATIVSQSMTYNGTAYTNPTGTLQDVQLGSFVFSATDSRGNTVTQTITKTVIDYIKLTCKQEAGITLEGETGAVVTLTIKGNYYRGALGTIQNSLKLYFRRTNDDGDMGNWIDIETLSVTPTINNDSTYEATLSIGGLRYDKSYIFQAKAVDALTGVETGEYTVRLIPVFDWGESDFNFNVPVTIQGGSVPSIVEQGTSGNWTYRKWADGTAECWAKKDFTVNVTSAWGNMFTSGAISESNLSFPTGLFIETPVTTVSLLVRSAGGIIMSPGGAGSNIANATQTGVYEIARGTSLSGGAYTINYDVKGKWK